MSTTTGGGEFGNPLRKFKLVFLGEQSGKCSANVKCETWTERWAGQSKRCSIDTDMTE